MLTSDDPDGTTPLDPDEAEGLLPTHIATVAALNEWEQANILSAQGWALRKGNPELLSIDFWKELHRRMFDETWQWAGRFRTSDTNIGVQWRLIPEAAQNLCDDAKAWMSSGVFETPEMAARLHHRLVQVHPFVNGNGRHARLLTNLVVRARRGTPPTWGGGDLQRPGEARTAYLSALRKADTGEFAPLIRFVSG